MSEEELVQRKKISRLVSIKPSRGSGYVGGGGDKFKNQVVVFTGFRNRIWESNIKQQGGKVGIMVTKNTTLVVSNDENSIKHKKAQELGIKIIHKDEFDA